MFIIKASLIQSDVLSAWTPNSWQLSNI